MTHQALFEHTVDQCTDTACHQRTRYRERLTTSVWLWCAGLALALLGAAEIHLGYSGTRSWLPYIVVPLGVSAVLWWLGRLPIRITETHLHVDDAVLPLSVVASAAPLTAEQKRHALGRDRHPLAFIIHRPWIGSAVLITLNDPEDPTPYWVISTRHPKRLIAAIDSLNTKQTRTAERSDGA